MWHSIIDFYLQVGVWWKIIQKSGPWSPAEGEVISGFVRPTDLADILKVISTMLSQKMSIISPWIKFFISAFLSSVSPSYLWIRHACWALTCLQGFHPAISPRNLGQNFPVGFQDVGSNFPRRFSGRNILKKKLSSWGTLYIHIYIYIGIFLYIHTLYSFPYGDFGSHHCGVFFKPGCQCPWWTPSEPPG